MYTAHIGKRILDLYNRERRTKLTPRAFFDEVFFPLFFDHEQYLMWVNNSKFDQKYKQRKRTPLTKDVRQAALEEFHSAAATLSGPHGHLLLGGTVVEATDTPASQVTDLTIPADSDQVYYSWFGAAAAVGVRSGLSVLVDDGPLLEALVEGWAQYRRFMEQTPSLRPHQIEAWNGHWIIHRLSDRYDPSDPVPPGTIPVQTRSGSLELSTVDWSQAIFALARGLSDRSALAYVYSLGRMNTTVGFIRLDLPAVQRFWELRDRLFGAPDGLSRRELERLYETELGFYRACEYGVIGLRALEPRDLRKYIPQRKSRLKGLTPARSTEERAKHTFYQTWIIAMLNNAKIVELAQSTAEILQQHAAPTERGKTTGKRRVDAVLKASGLRPLIEALTEIVDEDGGVATKLDALVSEISRMPRSNVPLFLTLIRFKYAVENASVRT